MNPTHAPPALAGMGERVAHEVHPAALPGGSKHAGNGRFDTLVGIGDDQLHTGEAAPLEPAQELNPEGFGL
jgi:hypothetical protein